MKIGFLIIGFFVGISLQATNEVDLVIFSCDRPLQLYALLESIDRHVEHVGQIHVIVRSKEICYKQAYDEVFKKFNNVVVKEQIGPHDFKETTIKSLVELTQEYILFAVDDIIVTDAIDLSYCVEMMQKHDSYGFFLKLGKNCTKNYPNPEPVLLPRFVFDDGLLCQWHFNEGAMDWGYPHTVDMTIYKKADIMEDLISLIYYAPNTLEALWAGQAGKIFHCTGICFNHSHMVNIPMNRVQNEIHNYNMGIDPLELLRMFNMGKKIDIAQFYRVNNANAHMNAIPSFIDR